MKNRNIFLSLLLLGAISVSTSSTALAQSTQQHIDADMPYTYSHGYDMGNDAARNNRSTMNSYTYLSWYSDALNQTEWEISYGDPSETQYWEGYYDGLEAGFNAASGGGVGGTGPIGDTPYNGG